MTDTPVNHEQSAPLPSDAEVLAWVRARWPHRAHADARAMKLAEEAGEVVGQVTRVIEGRGSVEAIAKEMAQTVMCLKGLAAIYDIDIDSAVRDEWAEMQTRQWEGALT